MTTDEFDAFYAASFSRLVGQIYALCGDLAEANDCVQEAFIRAWDRRRELDVSRSPDGWVRTVAYRLAVSRWRRGRRSYDPRDRTQLPAPPAQPGLDRITLVRALNQIPADQRRAIVLHHLCDLSVEDVAREVGAPAGTVKARLSRGRAALATLLTETTEETSRG
jgi:RNA polymerase sigma-70 factor (ECF subfamily)